MAEEVCKQMARKMDKVVVDFYYNKLLHISCSFYRLIIIQKDWNAGTFPNFSCEPNYQWENNVVFNEFVQCYISRF